MTSCFGACDDVPAAGIDEQCKYRRKRGLRYRKLEGPRYLQCDYYCTEMIEHEEDDLIPKDKISSRRKDDSKALSTWLAKYSKCGVPTGRK